MTDPDSPDEPNTGSDLARFLKDWTALWREEMLAQANDPTGIPMSMLAGMAKGVMPAEMTAGMEMWRTGLVAWANAVAVETSSAARAPWAPTRDSTSAPRAKASDVASDPRDAEIRNLARKIDELERRIAGLEAKRGRRG
jgi:hypothetical protein